MRRRTRVAAIAAIVTLTMAPAPALAAPDDTDWCDHYARTYPIAGWDVQCIDPNTEGVAGWVSEENKQLRLVRGMDQRTTQQAFGHEYAHIESSWFPAQTKQWWADQLGQKAWRINDYLRSPNEVWAENRSRCLGWHDGSKGAGYTVVDCSLVDQMLQRAKDERAKALAADRPVNTGASEEVTSRYVVQVAWDEKTRRNWAWTWRWDPERGKWVALSYAPA